MDEPTTTRQVHLDTLEYTRDGLRTRGPLDLTTGRHNRVILVRPQLATIALTAHHGFALDRAFPLPATLALLWAYRRAGSPLPAFETPAGPRGRLQVFGHTDASGGKTHNKTLSERRAAVILALLQTDVDAMLSIASEDGWTPWASGLAWIRDHTGGPFTLTLPEDLLLPHPVDTTTLKQDRTIADIDIERGATLELGAGQIARLRVQPPKAAPGYVSCHFDEGSVYPADTLVALVQQALDVLDERPDARITLFGHTRPTSSIDADKALSERRARLVHAVLISDLEALTGVVEDDAWADTHYISLAHFLGYEAEEPRRLWTSFQLGYSAGHHHAPDRDLGRGSVNATGKLDEPTKRALLDAFLATVGASIPPDAFAPTPCAGCASFNPPPEGDHPDRLTLTVFPDDQVPTRFPCLEGDASACHIEGEQPCLFFTERCAETSLQYRWLEDVSRKDEDVLYMGARVLVHDGARVASAVYNAPSVVEDISYAFLAPTPSSSPPPAPSKTPPRVHLTSRADKIGPRFGKSRLIRPEAVPDGDHLRPMEWADDGRTLDEIFLDFWTIAFEILSRSSAQPTRGQVAARRPELDSMLSRGRELEVPPDSVFDAVRTLTPTEFTTLVLTSSMVAAGQALNSFESKRYAPSSFRYACNIYTTDLINLLPHGAWVPKMQFSFPKRVQKTPSKAQSEKIFAVGPSGVNHFLTGRQSGGAVFGWHRIPGDKDVRKERRQMRAEAQRLANLGQLVVLSGGVDPDIGGVGHVAVIMPDLAFLSHTEKLRLAHTRGGRDNKEHFWDYDHDQPPVAHRRPVRSQAGAFNRHGIRGGTLVMGSDHEYRTPGYFHYDATTDKSRGSSVERP